MVNSTSIWAVAVVAVLSAILFPAANRFAPEAGASANNTSAASETAVDVIGPLADGLIGLLLFVAAVLTVASIITEGGW